MEIINKISEIRDSLSKERLEKKTIAFVPTMGFLHEGHLSLVKKAVEENDIVVVSIFVNSKQFGPDEDYDDYPRDIKGDAEKLSEYGVDYVFAPSSDEIYNPNNKTIVRVEKLSEHLCGLSRKGFFQGIAIIVTKLFNIIQPDYAYFGQKDFQQFLVLKQMVNDLNIPVELVMAPIVREKDGLAMSSRNNYLNLEEREAATILFKALNKGKEMVLNGEKDAKIVKSAMTEMIENEVLADIDYVAVADPDTLNDLEKINKKVLLATAVLINETRLIDNIYLELQ